MTSRASAAAAAVTPARMAGAPTQQQITDAAERLAAPSSVVVGVLRVLDEGTAPARTVAERLQASPELTVHVLRLANSALFGQRVDSLERAVVRIGERTLRALLLAASTYRLLEGPLALYGQPRLALFHHSSEVATMAQGIARRHSSAYSSLAYLGGLCHDLGKPIIASAVGRSVQGTIPPGDVEAERQLLGTDHARVGGWVARRWSLPSEVSDAMDEHHAPDPPEHPVARSVWLANIAVHASRGEPDQIERLGHAAAACGISSDQLEQMLSSSGGGEAPRKPPGLTPRETQVLRMLADGRTAKQVARELDCSASTIHNHLHHVYRKLGVSGQAQALLLARERNWL